jgi:hypothetical protein
MLGAYQHFMAWRETWRRIPHALGGKPPVRSWRTTRRQGQTVVEYVVSTVIFMLVVAILSVFLYTLREQNTRVLDLMASEYP